MDIWQLCPFPAASNGDVPVSCWRSVDMPLAGPGNLAHSGQGRWACPVLAARDEHMTAMSIPGFEHGTCSEVPPRNSGHAPMSRLGTVAMPLAGPGNPTKARWACPLPAVTTGHVASMPIPGCEQWTCSGVPVPSSGHAQRSRRRRVDMPSGRVDMSCARWRYPAASLPGRTSSARRRGSGCATDPRSAVRRRCGGIRRRQP